MASTLLSRALGVIEFLSSHARGASLEQISQHLDSPKASTTRLLNELKAYGYLAEDAARERFLLTTRLSALSMRFLSEKGVVDVAQPHLERLAEHCGELVRLAIHRSGELTFVAQAQGARAGLRYAPSPQEEKVPLYCTATAFAWLSQFSDDEALRRIAADGALDPAGRGPTLPQQLADIPPYLQQTRRQGYALVTDMSSPGMSALAVPLQDKAGIRAIGALAIGAPTARLSEAEITAYVPALQATAATLSRLSLLSELLRRAD